MITLYPWQQQSADHVTEILRSQNAAVDLSDTGTGKTYVALEVCKRLGVTPLIICPKAVIPSWGRVAKEMNVPVMGIMNPEKLKTGKFGFVSKGSRKEEWIWRGNVPLIIFDECHRFSGVKTQNAYLMASAKLYGIKTLSLSATVATDPTRLRALGFLLGLHRWRDFWSWTLEHGCHKNPWGGIDFTTNLPLRQKYLGKLHAEILPAKGVRVRVADLPEFPENEIYAESYELSDKATKAVDKAYAEAEEELDENPSTNPLTVLLRARQKAELCKVDLLADMTEDLLDEGKSVVVFVCFRETLQMLSAELQSRCSGMQMSVVHGGQNAESREFGITCFQQDKSRIMLAMVQAGGVGLSLHDLNGTYPRASLICPSYSAVELKQALGRVWRAGAKSKSVQRIVYAAGTVEEQACKAVQRKLANLDMLIDGDMQEGIKWERSNAS